MNSFPVQLPNGVVIPIPVPALREALGAEVFDAAIKDIVRKQLEDATRETASDDVV